MLHEQERRFTRLDVKVHLHLLALLAAKGRVGKDDVVAVLFLDVPKVFRKGVGVGDVGRLDAMKDEVHDADDIGQGLFFLAVKGALLELVEVVGGLLHPLAHVLIRLRTRKPAEPTAGSYTVSPI